ncbi:SRPBCC family protein [Arenimonas sp. MALMAid1274]|uniref:SRPBCC family protein n=1 Tax=Arenimonas sp. MALMAid1274 TaxID=3411630 RepID=UPI003BA37DED
MSTLAPERGHAALSDPATLTLERVLPGPIDRVWDYLTRGELRRQWLASGQMRLEVGAPFELVWRNDELTTPPGPRPAGFEAEHRMHSRILEVSPPHRLAFTWGEAGEVSFDLRQEGRHVRLTVNHRRPPSRDVLLKVAAGWHSHLDILADRIEGNSPAPFWPTWQRLRDDYETRLGV